MITKSKWQSRRWLICVWAVTITTIIIAREMISPTGADWISSSLGLLLAIVGGYIASDTITKPKVGEQ